MRKIKVRGYAVEEMVGSQWMYGTGIHVTEFTDEYAKETGKKEECFVWTESGWVEVHKESIGQYTGLKDKNGREIYEGDIVQRELSRSWEIKHFGQVITGVVKYLDDSYWIDFDVDATSLFCEIDPAEVIGNIYENPELLEVVE